MTAACHSSKVELKNQSAPAGRAANQPSYKAGPQPTEAELRDAIKRNYEDVVMIDSGKSTSFVIGDFNGDAAEDVAVVVKPGKGKLAELNSEYVNWILEDPHQVQGREQKTSKVPVTITRNDSLLAVIHGIKGEGWRNAMAKQTYLLKNAVGERFATESGQQLNDGSKRLPLLRGDVIREKLDGADGIIYWTGAKYAWHPVS